MQNPVKAKRTLTDMEVNEKEGEGYPVTSTIRENDSGQTKVVEG